MMRNNNSKSAPTLSILIPSYNDEDYIESAWRVFFQIAPRTSR